MPAELRDQDQLGPQDLIKTAKGFYNEAVEAISKNQGLMEALLQKYLKNPQGSVVFT